jgi:large subunit ribosomal protein L16
MPSFPVTKKPVGSRMGKGKGIVKFWIAPIKKGQILFEICGVSDFKAQKLFEKAGSKLPLKTKLVKLIY